MAAADALDAEPGATDDAILLDGFEGVLRAGGGVPAGGWREGRDVVLVKVDEGNQYGFHGGRRI